MNEPAKTATAKAEDQPDRVFLFQIHITEAMELNRCLEHYCETAKRHFDSSSHGFRLHDLIKLFREAIQDVDPEYAKMFFHDNPVAPGAKETPVVHHHHHYYHCRADKYPRGDTA